MLLASFLFVQKPILQRKRPDRTHTPGDQMKYRIIWLVMLLIVSCTPQTQALPSPDTPATSPPEDVMPASETILNPFAPQPGDEKLTRGNVYLNDPSLMIRESYPPQISLSIDGDLPTPCNQLRVKTDTPDQDNKIIVEVYSLINPDKVCIQVLEPFQENIDLGKFATGHYSVWVNGKVAGEFDY